MTHKMQSTYTEALGQPVSGTYKGEVREGAELLGVSVQDGQMVLAFLQSTHEPPDTKTVAIFRAGEDMGNHTYLPIGNFTHGGETFYAFEKV